MNVALLEQAVEAGKVRHAALSPAVRRSHGVVHTPAAVARFALARVDEMLRNALACPNGLGEARVALLDPALGTGIWLAAALERLHSSTTHTAHARAPWFGFDIDNDAVALTRTLLSPSAENARIDLTLTSCNLLTVADPWAAALDDHVRVIVGNPPWSARSQSRGLALSDAWLSEFRSDAQGISLGERRSGVLSDDYVRFFRWALEQARTSHAGAIICLATNSSYLDGPVHRGMRSALLRAFDEIHVLDLGGNALRGHAGGRDENVFGVRVGTCLTIALRKPGHAERRAHLTYRKLPGTAECKLAALAHGVIVREVSCSPSEPYYRFVPSRATGQVMMAAFSLAEAFPFHREGVQTNRDALVTDHHESRLRERLQDLAEGRLDVSNAAWLSEPNTRRILHERLNDNSADLFRKLAYRPLDERFYFSLAPYCHRPRPDLQRAVSVSALCLLSARKDRGGGPWNLFGVARTSADACYLSTRSSSRTRVFPSHGPAGESNLAPRVRDRLGRIAGLELSSAQVMAYCIGVLASASFRRDHDADLHLDYPRLPWPADVAAFDAHHRAGQAWIDAWLEPSPPADVVAPWVHAADLTFVPERSELTLGDRTLDGVTAEIWSFSVGDFAVLNQLKRAPTLSFSKLFSAFERVRRCVDAAAQAERAYLLTRPVR